MDLTLAEIQKAIRGDLSKEFDGTLKIKGVSTDSRTIKKGEAFFAVKGEKFDGTKFVKDALMNGASAVIVSNGENIQCKKVICVRDTKKALINLASYYRKKINPKVCGITGSNGKTTTKDVLALLLEDTYNVVKNRGNFNNEIGLPLTILDMAKSTEVLILEMGMSGKGELSVLNSAAQPDVGIITNVGPAHLAYFSSLKEIASAKAELIEGLTEDKFAVLNADDYFYDFFRKKTRAKIITFGVKNKSDFMAEDIRLFPFKGSTFVLNVQGKKIKVKTSLPGLHNVYNILAAMAAGSMFFDNLCLLAGKLEKAKPPKMRLEVVNIKDIKIVNDAYNANPDSVMAVLKELGDYEAKGKKVFVFGGMLELGNDSKEYHRKIGEEIVKQDIDYLIIKESDGTVITSDAAIQSGMDRNKIFLVKTNEDIVNILLSFIKKQDTILFKGSRATRLEEAVELLKWRVKNN
ncbi:MAG: UDP-N-acetylmuramoyl-tripeptide--D-alanyl-D-alanine ligase [bacterium]